MSTTWTACAAAVTGPRKAIEILKANGEDAYRLGVIGEGSGVQLV